MNPSEQPLGVATTISGALITLAAAAVAMLTALGVVHWDTAQQATVNAFVMALISVGALVGPYLWARKKVTPLAAPTAKDGEPLVRASGDPTPPKARSMAKG